MELRQGSVALVTGAASGLGRALAGRLAGCGVRLALADRDDAGLARVLADLAARGADVASFRVDVRDLESCREMVRAAAARFGRIDALVHCAGLVRPAPFCDGTPEDEALMVEVNLMGTIHVSKAVLPVLLAQNAGHVVHVGSLAGRAPVPGEAVYCASKYGVRGFSLALGLELRHTPIRVSLVCPDTFDSPATEEEARSMAAPLSFSAPVLPVERVVDGVLRALRSGSPEVCVPAYRGFLTALADLFPGLRGPLLPLLERAGRKRLAELARTSGGRP